MRQADLQDAGYHSRAFYQAGNTAVTAGGGGDNTAINGAWTSRNISGKGIAKSVKILVAYSATLASGQTLSIACKLQDATSSGGANSADVAATHLNSFSQPLTVVASATGSNTGVAEFDFPLETCREFIRAVVTPDLSASGTDTATIQVIGIMYGTEREPLSNTLI